MVCGSAIEAMGYEEARSSGLRTMRPALSSVRGVARGSWGGRAARAHMVGDSAPERATTAPRPSSHCRIGCGSRGRRPHLQPKARRDVASGSSGGRQANSARYALVLSNEAVALTRRLQPHALRLRVVIEKHGLIQQHRLKNYVPMRWRMTDGPDSGLRPTAFGSARKVR